MNQLPRGCRLFATWQWDHGAGYRWPYNSPQPEWPGGNSHWSQILHKLTAQHPHCPLLPFYPQKPAQTFTAVPGRWPVQTRKSVKYTKNFIFDSLQTPENPSSRNSTVETVARAAERFLVAIKQENSTQVTEFLLLGFGAQHNFEYALYIVFLVIWVTSMVSNIGMILLIKTDSRLRTPCTASYNTWLLLISPIPLLSLPRYCKTL